MTDYSLISQADVTSSNVVGYKKLDLTCGWSMVTPVFKPVDATAAGYDLTNLVPEGDNLYGDGDVNVQLMSADGEWVGQYWYYTPEAYPLVAAAGWYDEEDNGVSFGDVTLTPGVALMVECASEDIKLRALGEVEFEASEIPVSTGWSMFGNCSLDTINLSEIIPSDNVYGDGDVNVQLMSAGGEWIGQYWYYTPKAYPLVTTAGWYDENDDLAGDVYLAPGDSVMLECASDDVTLTIPAPLVTTGNGDNND